MADTPPPTTVESWADAPELGVATYLFWPFSVGALVLFGCAARLVARHGPGITLSGSEPVEQPGRTQHACLHVLDPRP
jgi:hypothetical protein